MEPIGIEHLKTALGSVIKMAKAIDVALDDKKINIMEGIKIAVAGFGIWTSVKDFAQIKSEYNDLSADEKEELSTYFANEFDINEEDIELLIEEVFSALLQLTKVVNMVHTK